MSAPFLDKAGFTHLWSKIAGKFVAKEEGKGLSSNDFTDDDKNKLDSLDPSGGGSTIKIVRWS